MIDIKKVLRNLALRRGDPVDDDQLLEVWYGEVGKRAVRSSKPDTTPDDDSGLPVTPPDVVELLGFDPLEE